MEWEYVELSFLQTEQWSTSLGQVGATGPGGDRGQVFERFGNLGWELVALTQDEEMRPAYLWFKRPRSRPVHRWAYLEVDFDDLSGWRDSAGRAAIRGRGQMRQPMLSWLGAQGWEIVAALAGLRGTPRTLFCKRPSPDDLVVPDPPLADESYAAFRAEMERLRIEAWERAFKRPRRPDTVAATVGHPQSATPAAPAPAASPPPAKTVPPNWAPIGLNPPPPGLRYEPAKDPPTLDRAAAIAAVRDRWQPGATSYEAYHVLFTNRMGGTLDTAGHLHPRWSRVSAWVVVCYGRFPTASGPFRPAGPPPAGDYDHVYHALDANTGEHLMGFAP